MEHLCKNRHINVNGSYVESNINVNYFNSKAKGNVVTVLPLTEHHTMKRCWGSGNIAPSFL
jgi:hypothetical protein